MPFDRYDIQPSDGIGSTAALHEARGNRYGPAPLQRSRYAVLGCPIDAVSAPDALDRIISWARQRSSRAVYFCNAHSIVTGTRQVDFAKLITRADLAAPDGMPVAWVLRRHGFPEQQRVCGPDLMEGLCERAAERKLSIFLFGSDEATLALLRERLAERFPGLVIAGTLAPPFRPLTAEEDDHAVRQIRESGASIVLVGLGCPKQERWIHAHLGHIDAVMIGVGAAFQFHAGTVRRAPPWMQQRGLEWLHRLVSEPRKLWKRYLVTNVLFISGVLRDRLARELAPWRSRA